jgi:hypothetical protein
MVERRKGERGGEGEEGEAKEERVPKGSDAQVQKL